MSEQVAEPSAEQQEAAEGEQVGVHDPRERLLREAEVVTDRRERDVHYRPVEDDHQVAEAEHDECEPAGAGVVDRHRGVLSSGRARGGSLVGRRSATELIDSRLPSACAAAQ